MEDPITIRRSGKGERFAAALSIQEGACNPSGIARALVQACAECLDNGVAQRSDPAVRLIVHQLAYLCNVSEIDSGSNDVYGRLTRDCAHGVESMKFDADATRWRVVRHPDGASSTRFTYCGAFDSQDAAQAYVDDQPTADIQRCLLVIHPPSQT